MCALTACKMADDLARSRRDGLRRKRNEASYTVIGSLVVVRLDQGLTRVGASVVVGGGEESVGGQGCQRRAGRRSVNFEEVAVALQRFTSRMDSPQWQCNLNLTLSAIEAVYMVPHNDAIYSLLELLQILVHARKILGRELRLGFDDLRVQLRRCLPKRQRAPATLPRLGCKTHVLFQRGLARQRPSICHGGHTFSMRLVAKPPS